MIVIIKLDDKIMPKRKLRKDIYLCIDEIVDFFKNNKDRWMTADDLRMSLSCLTDTLIMSSSTIRQIINYLRVEMKQPIIASRKGYKYTNNKEELCKYHKLLLHRAMTVISAAKAIKNNLRNGN